MSIGVLFLLKLFFLRPFSFEVSGNTGSEMVYDLVSYIFLFYKEHQVLPEFFYNKGTPPKKLKTVMENEDTISALHEYLQEQMNVEKGPLQTGDTIAGVREFVRQERGEITAEEINEFVRVMVENKILTDKGVNQVVGLLSAVVNDGSAPHDEQSKHKVYETESLKLTKNAAGLYTEQYLDNLSDEEFARLELEARKSNVQAKYHPYINDIGVNGLLSMKKLFTDFFGDPFEPRGRQRRTLANLRRWTTIVSSRRGGKCVYEEEDIRLADGTYKKAKDVDVGDVLLSSDKKTPIGVKRKKTYQKGVYRVTLDNGMTIDVTGDHHMPTQKNYRNGKWDMDINDYKQAHELTKKDFVPVCLCFDNPYIEFSEQKYYEAKLFGYILGDGCHGTNRIACFSDKIAENIIATCDALGKEARYDKDKNFVQILDGKVFKHEHSSLKNLACDKYIPNYVYGRHRNEKIGLLHGYIETDGYIQHYSNKSVRIQMSTVSEKLADGILRLCYDAGIIAYKRSYKKKTNFSGGGVLVHQVSISDYDSICMLFNSCDFSGKKNYEIAVKSLEEAKDKHRNNSISIIPLEAWKNKGFIRMRSDSSKYDGTKKIKPPHYDFQRRKAENYGLEDWLRYSWHRVVSVEYIGEKTVVDIEVGGDHLYWVGNILSHNTYFGSYLVSRQLYLPNQTIVYVVPTLKNQAGTPFRYMEMFFGNDPDIKMDRSNRTIRHKKLKSEIIFLSAERDTNVRSQAANLIVYDEAAFISEKVYETASALVRTTQGMVYIISTVNPDTPKNWFYYKLIEAEIDMFHAEKTSGEVLSLARRVTLHDNPFIDEAEKRSIIKDGQRNPKLFGAEWMCEFQESEDFDLKNFWKIDYEPVAKTFADLRTVNLYKGVVIEEVGGQRGKNTYEHFYVSYDAAKRKDQPALSIVGITSEKKMVDGMLDVEVPVAEVVGAGYMSNLEYYEQVKVIVDVVRYFGGRDKVTLIVELNNTGIVIEEILRREYQLFAVGITAVGGIICKRDAGNWYVGTKLMLGKLKTAMSMGQLRGYSFMNELRMEFESYDEESVNKRKDGHHFDILSSLRGSIWYISKTGKLLGNDEDEYDDRYESEDPRGQAFSLPQTMLGGYQQRERGRFSGGGF